MATVTVIITSGENFFNLVSIRSETIGSDTNVTIKARGIPGCPYTLQRATALVESAFWSNLSSRTAGSSGTNVGLIIFTDTNPPSPSYYRTTYPQP